MLKRFERRNARCCTVAQPHVVKNNLAGSFSNRIGAGGCDLCKVTGGATTEPFFCNGVVGTAQEGIYFTGGKDQRIDDVARSVDKAFPFELQLTESVAAQNIGG